MSGKNGLARNHPDYCLYIGVKRRTCYQTKKDLKYYKNITLDPKWRTFKGFNEDMGDRPNSKMTIDRIDPSKGYYKENCRWATWSQQAYNRRPRKTCLKGHKWTEESIIWERNGTTKRCKICRRKNKYGHNTK